MPKVLPHWISDEVNSLHEFSRIRLVAVDLDGTLLQPGSQDIFNNIEGLIKSLRHYQVHFTLATGRTLAGVLPLLKRLPIPEGTPLILYNGSVITRVERSEILSRRLISVKSLHQILKMSTSQHIPILIYFFGYPVETYNSLFELSNSYEHVLGWSNTKYPKQEFNGMTIRWLDSDKVFNSPMPTAIIMDFSDEPEAINILERQLAEIPEISITRSGSPFIEIRPQGSSKGVALEFVAKYLNMSQEEVLALGDNDNDAEMLAWAGIGVSIAGASSRALQRSNYVCRHGAAEGAVEVLRLIRDAKRYFNPPRKRKFSEE